MKKAKEYAALCLEKNRLEKEISLRKSKIQTDNLSEEAEEKNVKSSKITISAINYPNGEKRVSAIYWDKGPIIVDVEDEME